MADSIESFFRAWGLADAGERLSLIRKSVSDAATYADPRTPDRLSGPEAIAEYVGAFSQAAPGAEAVVADTQSQAGLTRATVAFRMPGGMEQLGQYFIETDDEGRIVAMTGFVGTGAPV